MAKRALLTGITGQDGSYLSELLLEKGYDVHGIVRRSSTSSTARIEHLAGDPALQGTRMFLHHGDLSDTTLVNRLLRKIKPDEIYNLGAQGHVRESFDVPVYTANVTGVATVRLLQGILDSEYPTRFYQASSSEMFGKVLETPQRETTPFYPRSPYGCAKVFAFYTTVNYREAYGMHASNGILFNHESPRRGEAFVTRKITSAVARILADKQDKLFVGNLDAKRDWGYAKDYVDAMWRMVQADAGDDYVIATGETHSVREFVEAAFSLVGLDWQKYVEVDPKFYRPTEVDVVVGDPSKAKAKLGWQPTVKFREIVKMMIEADLKALGLDPHKYVS